MKRYIQSGILTVCLSLPATVYAGGIGDIIEDAFTYITIAGNFTANFMKGLCDDTICKMHDSGTDEAYLDSWTVTALRHQNRIDRNVPLKLAVLPHTHNSYNSEAYMTTTRYLDPNQRISVLNQLNIGIRALELDVHWEKKSNGNYDVILCHNGGQGICSPYDRVLGEALEEIKFWFSVSEHKANDVVLITFEDHLDGHYAEAVAYIEQYIGGLVFKPGSCTSFSDLYSHVTKADILESGKNIVLINSSSTSCAKGGYGSYVYRGNWSGSVKHETFVGYPTCSDGSKNITTILGGYYRSYNDGTIIGQDYLHDPLHTVASVEALVSCGVNSPGPEPMDWNSSWHAAQIWSWATDEPNDSNGEDCAISRSDGRFNDVPCTNSYRYACQHKNDLSWKITSSSGPWTGGTTACTSQFGSNYEFGVPANGYFNNTLRDAKTAAGASTVYLRYSDRATEGIWLP